MRKISHLLVREDNRRRWPGGTRGSSMQGSAVRHRAASNRRTCPIPKEDRLPTQFDGNGMGCWISSYRFFNEDGPSKPPHEGGGAAFSHGKKRLRTCGPKMSAVKGDFKWNF